MGSSIQEITSTGARKGEVFLVDICTELKNKNITSNIKVDTNSNVSQIFLLICCWTVYLLFFCFIICNGVFFSLI